MSTPTPPPSMRALRIAWSTVHVLIVLALLCAGFVWWTTDDQGKVLFDTWWNWALDIQRSVSSWIPFPWDTE